jgi:hypothetical protein
MTVENYAAFLARNPPREEIEIVSPSSWSCPHGVERWRSDDGCRTAPERGWQQAWRKPLREGLNWLASELHALFVAEATPLFGDPWAARDANGGDAFARPAGTLSIRARELLELERSALAMFSSCAWFFDDVGGVETALVLRLAARAIELAGEPGARLEAGLLRYLAEARSNQSEFGDGARIYRTRVKPSLPAPVRAAAGFAALTVMSVADTQLPGYAMAQDGNQIRVTDRRTDRTYDVKVQVSHPSPARLEMTVPSPSPSLSIHLSDLPDRHRTAVHRAMIQEMVDKYFSRDDLALLASGGADLGGVALRALEASIEDLAQHGNHGVARVSDLLDLLDLLGSGVSFEAQTRFHRARAAMDPPQAGRLALIASRMGFGSP